MIFLVIIMTVIWVSTLKFFDMSFFDLLKALSSFFFWGGEVLHDLSLNLLFPFDACTLLLGCF